MSEHIHVFREWRMPACAKCRKRRHEMSRGEWCSLCQAVTETELIDVVEKEEA